MVHQLHHLLTSIAKNKRVGPHGATLEDGYRASEVCDAIIRSAKGGKREAVASR
jgi:predicted dehydrogenase